VQDVPLAGGTGPSIRVGCSAGCAVPTGSESVQSSEFTSVSDGKSAVQGWM